MRTLWHTQLSTTSRSVVILLLSSHVYRVYTLHDGDRIVKSACQRSRNATAWCATPDQPSRPATLQPIVFQTSLSRPALPRRLPALTGALCASSDRGSILKRHTEHAINGVSCAPHVGGFRLPHCHAARS